MAEIKITKKLQDIIERGSKIGMTIDDFRERKYKNSPYRKPTQEELEKYNIALTLWQSRRKRYVTDYKKEVRRPENADWLRAHPMQTSGEEEKREEKKVEIVVVRDVERTSTNKKRKSDDVEEEEEQEEEDEDYYIKPGNELTAGEITDIEDEIMEKIEELLEYVGLTNENPEKYSIIPEMFIKLLNQRISQLNRRK